MVVSGWFTSETRVSGPDSYLVHRRGGAPSKGSVDPESRGLNLKRQRRGLDEVPGTNNQDLYRDNQCVPFLSPWTRNGSEEGSTGEESLVGLGEWGSDH